jgi:chromosome segregation ATPase
MDVIDPEDPPDKPRKTGLQNLQDEMRRQLAPLRQIQEMQDLVQRHSPDYRLRDLTRLFEPDRQIREMLERTTIPKHVQEIIDGNSIAEQARRVMEQYLPKNTFGGVNDEFIRRAAGLSLDNKFVRRLAGLDSISDAVKRFEEQLAPISQQRDWLEKLQRQAFGGLSTETFARQLEQANPAFREMEDAKRSLDKLWSSFRDVDFSQFEADEREEQEAKQAAQSITEAAADQASFHDAVDRIVAAIQAQQKPAVQLMLWLFFRKILDWLIAGAIGAAMGHYASAVLGESPQAAKKAVQETARIAVGTTELLLEYRYVSAKVLIVRQNPRALSPEVARLTFGKPVKLVQKKKDFALVLWTDKESGTEVQGWVFARYLSKFN